VRRRGDPPERLLVDVDRHGPVDLVAEDVLRWIRRKAPRPGADGVDLDAEGSRGLGRRLGRDPPRVLLAVRHEDDELALRGRGAAGGGSPAVARAEPIAVPSSIIPTSARSRFWRSQP